ncbi:hypothetical protein [Ornithinibacillus bavariensis]|uniref:Uncharacterized protein n=1 Tax=Ornithinibacillus bavariensis TaxID=545502 RepID=A0A920C8P2_9BACI|nr:hypothetical protein [Ornithinibacillus bavariensis]GIO27822.1 hypothetical protein J43TS3_24330 [Ornithinibacillus bavariensis]
MRHYAILRILLAAFFLYFAWPLIPKAETQIEMLFWGSWMVFLLLVIGANFATLLKLADPPVMEQEYDKQRQTDS